MLKSSRNRVVVFTLAVAIAGQRPGLASYPRAAGMRFAGGSTHGPAGYLGVDVRDVGDDQVSALRLKDSHGAEIVRVDHDGPAGKIGLREHDVIVRMNGQAIEGEEQIRRMLREMTPGRPVALAISRDGQMLTVTTQMANREEVERQAWQQHLSVPEPVYTAPLDPAPESAADSGMGSPVRGSRSFLGSMLLMTPSYTGAMLEILGPQLADFFGVPGKVGLLVRSIAPNSPAAMAGMHAGDVVVRANSQRLASTADWTKTIKESKGRPITVVVLRDRHEIILTLIPDGKRRSSLDVTDSTQQWACLTEL